MLLATPVYAESCVAYIHDRTGAPLVDAQWYQNFPRTIMAVGSIALFKYHNGVSHVALVEALGMSGLTISECNYHHGVCGLRYVPYDDYSLVGFWQAPNQTTSYLQATQQVADSNTTNTTSLAVSGF